MNAAERIRAQFEEALAGPSGQPAGGPEASADRLCRACVALLPVDGAAISVVHDGQSRGTFGSSGPLSRTLDEFQFTFGEGPCLDAHWAGRPVLVPDLDDAREHRWPAYSPAVLGVGVHGVFALPVAVANASIGVLDLFRHEPGQLTRATLTGGLLAARLAAVPLLDLVASHADWAATTEQDGGPDAGWSQLASLERVEVYQATGMLMELMDVAPAEALVRLRAHAFALGRTASEVGWAVVERRLTLDEAGEWRGSVPTRTQR